MKKSKIRILTAMVAVVMVVCALPMTASATWTILSYFGPAYSTPLGAYTAPNETLRLRNASSTNGATYTYADDMFGRLGKSLKVEYDGANNIDAGFYLHTGGGSTNFGGNATNKSVLLNSFKIATTKPVSGSWVVAFDLNGSWGGYNPYITNYFTPEVNKWYDVEIIMTTSGAHATYVDGVPIHSSTGTALNTFWQYYFVANGMTEAGDYYISDDKCVWIGDEYQSTDTSLLTGGGWSAGAMLGIADVSSAEAGCDVSPAGSKVRTISIPMTGGAILKTDLESALSITPAASYNNTN